MSLILDTHALLWFTLNDPQLNAAAKAAIINKPDEVYVSPASFWENAIKISLGKYQLNVPSFEMFWQKAIAQGGFTILPIEISHADKLSTLPFHHRDPFDRLIVAQALVENLVVVSNDVALDRYGIRRVW